MAAERLHFHRESILDGACGIVGVPLLGSRGYAAYLRALLFRWSRK